MMDCTEPCAEYSGVDLMSEVFDLMRHRLPWIPPDDPYRLRLMALLPAMGSALGRDRLVPVPADRAHRTPLAR